MFRLRFLVRFLQRPMIHRFSYNFTLVLCKIHMAKSSFSYIFHLLNSSLSSGYRYPPLEELLANKYLPEIEVLWILDLSRCRSRVEECFEMFLVSKGTVHSGYLVILRTSFQLLKMVICLCLREVIMEFQFSWEIVGTAFQRCRFFGWGRVRLRDASRAPNAKG